MLDALDLQHSPDWTVHKIHHVQLCNIFTKASPWQLLCERQMCVQNWYRFISSRIHFLYVILVSILSHTMKHLTKNIPLDDYTIITNSNNKQGFTQTFDYKQFHGYSTIFFTTDQNSIVPWPKFPLSLVKA